LIRVLSRSHNIDLISFLTDSISTEQLNVMRKFCQNMMTTEYRTYQQNPIRSNLGFLSKKPRSVAASYNSEMQALIHQASRNAQYDLLISSQVDMIAYTHTWKSSPMILEEIELTSLFEEQIKAKNWLDRSRHQIMWLKWRHYIEHVIESYRCCTVVSDIERLRVKNVAPHYERIEIIPNGVDTTYLSGDYGAIEPDSIIYPGALTYFPNLDAVNFFLQEVFPVVKRQRPNAKLYITGSTKGVDLKGLSGIEGVVFTGYLPDIRPRIARSAVCIVPLRFGGGTRLKILEALALKTPIVSTQKGVEGLDFIPEEGVLLADDPHQFAELVIRILEDRSLRDQLGRMGCQSVRQRYDWEIIGEKLSNVIKNVV